VLKHPIMPVQTLTVTEDEAGMRLDRWFKRHLPTLSLAHLNKIVRTGQVRIDGARATTATRLEAGQKIRIPPMKLAPEAQAAAPSEEDKRAIRAMILYEDDYLMVLNKPFGLAVQGGSGTPRHIDGMLASLVDARGERPVLVHRLDRDTCGVLLVAKSRRMAADLGEIFRSRRATKIYWALVEGVPKPARGRISLFLAKGEGMEKERGAPRRGAERTDLEKMRVAQHGEADAQHSVTYYATVDKVPGRLAWLSMKPITGRTHQLRAHAEAIGHPIVGDPKYRGELRAERQIPEGIERKLHLLARRIVLPHPRGGVLDVTAPLPPHMRKSFEMFGFDAKREDPIEEAPE